MPGWLVADGNALAVAIVVALAGCLADSFADVVGKRFVRCVAVGDAVLHAAAVCDSYIDADADDDADWDGNGVGNGE